MISPSKKRKLLARIMRNLKAAEQWTLVLHDDSLPKRSCKKAIRTICLAAERARFDSSCLEEDLCDP